MVKVKICGLTRAEDALAAAAGGADALGFVFADSPRRVTPDQARGIIKTLPPLVLTVGVFVNEEPEEIEALREYCLLDAVQLHGEESRETAARLRGRVIKALKMGRSPAPSLAGYPSATLLLDTYHPDLAGGSGRTFDWSLAVDAARRRPIILAGGLNPDNVAEAVRIVRPYAVDVSSGIETEPGRKDHEKLKRFITRAKSVD